MKLINYFLLIVLLNFSCSIDYHDYGKNPNGISELPSHFLLPGIQVQSVKNIGSQPMRVAGIIMNQLEGGDICAPMNYFIIGRDVMDNYWIGGAYAGSLTNAIELETLATEREEFFYRGVARVFLANEFGVLTSCFGDVPFSQALRGADYIQPKYDSQEFIYEGIQTLLDKAIDDLLVSIERNEIVNGDLIFDGATRKWIATAYALKARFYVHTSKNIPENWSKAQQAVENAFSYDFEDADLAFEANSIANWSLNKFVIERPATISLNSSFYQKLTGDPRRSIYATEELSLYHPDSTHLTWTQADASVPLISACELFFILAENAVRNGDNEEAHLQIKNAIRANFKMLSLPEPNNYIDSFDLGIISIESLMEEAYKSYFGYNFLQVWVNYRRTGYPKIDINSSQNSNSFNPSGSIPGRFMYVQSEFRNNRKNLQEAEARQGGGLLDNPLWIFR